MIRSIDGNDPVVNARPIRTRDYSIEIQRSGPAALPALYKGFHLVTLFLTDDTLVRRRGVRDWTTTRFAPGESCIRAAGPGDRVEWPVGVHALHVHLHPRLVRRVGGAIHGLENLALDTQRRLRDAEIRAIGLELHDSIHPNAVDGSTVRGLVTDLAEHVARHHGTPAPPSPRIGSLRLEDVFDAFLDDAGNWEGVANLATRAGLTRSHFSRRIRALTGLAPSAMARGNQIEAAKNLLERTSISLAEVAYRTGFADQSHFHRVFRRATHVTPTRYREARGAGRTP